MEALNKDDNDYALRWAKKIKAVNLLGGQCTICGEDNFFCLDFHHVDDKKKKWITELLHSQWSKIGKEIKKCVLVCRNCHTKLHGNGDKRNRRLKEKLLDLKGKRSCSVCGYNKNIGSLVFHHKGSKKFEVNVYRVRHADVTWEDILLEMDECDVLCSNCHIIEQVSMVRFNCLRPHIDYKVEHHKEKRSALDKDEIYNMYFNQGMRQVDIVKHFGCSKGTISGIIKKLKSSR